MNKLNFKQPKYIMPLVAVPFILLIAYGIGQFSGNEKETEKEEYKLEENKAGLITSIPDAEIKETDMLDKFSALKDKFKKSKDYSSISEIEEEESGFDEAQTSLYTEQEKRVIDSLQNINKINNEKFSQLRDGFVGNDYDDEDKNKKQKENTYQNEIDVFKKQMEILDSIENARNNPQKNNILSNSNRNINNIKAKKEIASVEKKDPIKDNFNTINEHENSIPFIKAIIDTDLKKVEMGSRIKIRLLDDILIKNKTLKKGSVIYGNVDAFSAQRVGIKITSILVNDEIINVALTIYDIDGQPGFFVPRSSFRDFTKQMGARVQGQNIQIEQDDNNVQQFMFSALKDIYRGTTQAISKQITKNKAHIKYNSVCFLIDENNLEK